MAEFQLPELEIGKETAEKDIKTLVKTIKPKWKEDSLLIKPLTGGFSCSTYFCNDSTDKSDKGITIRVRKLFDCIKDHPFGSVERENKIVQVVSKFGIMPKIYAIFKNGYCYEYIKGKHVHNAADPSAVPDFSNLPLKQIAEKLAKIHAVKVEGEDYTKTDFFDKLTQLIEEKYPDDPELGITSKEDVKRYLYEIIPHAKKVLANTKIGLCHGDPHLGNVVYNEEEAKVTIVDWELSSINYIVYDIAYFLQMFRFMRDMPAMPGMPQVSREQIDQIEKMFIKSYLEKVSELKNEVKQVTEEEIEDLIKQIDMMSLVLNLYLIGMFGPLIGILEDPNLDPKMMIHMMTQTYLKMKDDTLQKLGCQ